MARFPKQKANILALAASMVEGLKSNPAVFGAPPVIWALLTLKKVLYYAKRDAMLAAAAHAETAVTAKNEALEALTAAMKGDLRYAENTVSFDDDKLKLIGWAGKKAKTPLAVPGQSRLLEAPKQGATGGDESFLIGKHPQTVENQTPTKSNEETAPLAHGERWLRQYLQKQLWSISQRKHRLSH